MTAEILIRQLKPNQLIVRLTAFSDQNNEYFQLTPDQKRELQSPFVIDQKPSGPHFYFGIHESVAVVDLKYIVASKLTLASGTLRKKVKSKILSMDVLELMLRDCQTAAKGEKPVLTFVTDLQKCKLEESPTKMAPESEYITTIKVGENEQLLELSTRAFFVFLSQSGNVESSLEEECLLKFLKYEAIDRELDLSQIDMAK